MRETKCNLNRHMTSRAQMLLQTRSVRQRLVRERELLLACANYMAAANAIKGAMEDQDDEQPQQ